MNVPFRLADEKLDKAFLAGAEARGLLNLKGHRSVGGMRASIYNAVGLDAVRGAGSLHGPVREGARLMSRAGTAASAACAHRQPRREDPRADQRARALRRGSGAGEDGIPQGRREAGVLPPRARGLGAQAHHGAATRGRWTTRKWRGCSARSCPPAWRWSSRSRSPISARKAPSARPRR